MLFYSLLVKNTETAYYFTCREHEEKLRKEREVAMADKESAMARMKELLTEERDTAVAAAKIQEQNMAASELAAIISAQVAVTQILT